MENKTTFSIKKFITRPFKNTGFPLPSLIVLFFAGFIMLWRFAGLSPVIGQDTLEDQKWVSRCIDQDLCPAVGLGTSLGTIQQGVDWIYMRIGLEWLGISINGVHRGLLIATSLAFVLLAMFGARIGGPFIGIGSALLFAYLILSNRSYVPHVLNNTQFVPFMATLFTLTGILSVTSRKFIPLLLFAILGALLTDLHLCHVAAIFSVLWIALSDNKKSLRKILLILLIYEIVLFSFSFGTWQQFFKHFITDSSNSIHVLKNTDFNFSQLETWGWSAVIMLIVARFFVKKKKLIPILYALLGMLMPFLIVFRLGNLLAGAQTDDKYILVITPTIALSLFISTQIIFNSLSTHFARSFNLKKLSLFTQKAAFVLPWLLLITTMLLPFSSVDSIMKKDEEHLPGITISDINSIHDYIVRQKKWSIDDIYSGIKGPLDFEIIQYFSWFFTNDFSKKSLADKSLIKPNLLILKAHPKIYQKLKIFITDKWNIIKQSDGILLLGNISTWLDWGNFQICINKKNQMKCHSTGLKKSFLGSKESVTFQYFPMVAKYTKHNKMNLILKIPVILPGNGESRVIFMPYIPRRCRGIIKKIKGPVQFNISPDKRYAELKSIRKGKAILELQWTLGGTDCRGWCYGGFIPFFLESDPASALLFRKYLKLHLIGHEMTQ